MKRIPFRTVLALSPHTDDVELGCGGTLARFAESGCEVHVAVFSTCSDSLPEGSAPDALEREFRRSMSALGILTAPHVYNYPVRKLPESRQEVLEHMVRLRDTIRPDLVLMPSPHDLHQDHHCVSQEALRAFKGHASIFGYELVQNHISFDAEAFVSLSPRHMAAKWRALEEYKTQFALGRPYFDRAYIEGHARMRGVQIGETFSEAFEVLRLRVSG